ncbi:MAG: hypothetical protein J2P20_12065, partial [Pseudonocardia sp.]|nr:hypothetical protein [Pseudonocardia sp.]
MDPFGAVRALRPRAARKAEFVRFHNDTYPGLVALLHALHGDRRHAHRAAQRAFADAWLRWERVRSLPDPAAWTRRRARRIRPPRHRPPPPAGAGHEPGWIAPPARPLFDALSELPSELRTVLALHHIGGLDHGQIADEEHLPRGEVSARLAYAGQALALRMGRVTAEDPAGPEPRVVDPWVARELADLAHALSYRTDRQAADQVFGQAVRHRAAVATATVAVLALAGVAGLFALRQNVPGIPEAAPGVASPSQPAGPPASAAPALPGLPPMSGAQPTPALPPRPGAHPSLGALPPPGSPSVGQGAGGPDHEVGEASGRTGSSAHRDQVRDARGGGVRPTASQSVPGRTHPPASTGSPHAPTSTGSTNPQPTTSPPSTSQPGSTTSAPPSDGGPSDGGPDDGPLGSPDDQDGSPDTHADGGSSQDWPDGHGGQRGTRVDDGRLQARPGTGGDQRSGPDDG